MKTYYETPAVEILEIMAEQTVFTGSGWEDDSWGGDDENTPDIDFGTDF